MKQIELFKLFGKIAIENDEANDALDETTKKGSDSQTKLLGAFKKIGAGIATYFAADKIISFGKELVNAAAEVSAETSAFEQIMGDYADEAAAKVSKIADATGMVDSRLKPYMTSMTAKFKGLGYDIDDATDLASDGLNLAADAAAFWDKSLEDSMSGLNSFINGSYEGGEAIGLFANDTQIAAFAVQEGVVSSTKAWANLDEATKQATRLEYAQAMYEQSGATGQAAKEAGQYANVQANLNEKWRIFKAEIGAPLLQNIVIPAMDMLSGLIDKISAAYEKLQPKLQAAQDKFNELASYANETFAPAFDKLRDAFSKVKDALQPLIDRVKDFFSNIDETDVMDTFKGAIDTVADGVSGLADMVSGAVDGVKDLYDWAKNNTDTLAALAGVVGTLTAAIVAYNIQQAIKNAGGIVEIAQLAATAAGVAGLTVAEWAHNAAATAGAIATTAFGAAVNFLTSPVTLVVLAIGALITIIVLLVKNWDKVEEVAKQVWDKICEIWGKISDWFKANVVDPVVNKFNELKEKVTSKIEELRAKAKEVFDKIKSNIIDPIKNAVQNVRDKFNEMKSNVVSKITELRTNVQTKFNEIKEKITKPINDAKDKVKEIVDKIKGFFSGLKLELPKIKLPHFKLSGKLSLNPPSVPKMSIDWYAKAMNDGMILNSPTIFGVNGNGQLMAGGEAGSETVVGTQSLLEMINNAVKNETSALTYGIDRLISMLAAYFPQILENMKTEMVLDSGTLVGQLIPQIDDRLGDRTRLKARGN